MSLTKEKINLDSPTAYPIFHRYSKVTNNAPRPAVVSVSELLPSSSIATTIASARAMVAAMEPSMDIHKPASLLDPSRPYTPALNRRHSTTYRQTGSLLSSAYSYPTSTVTSTATTRSTSLSSSRPSSHEQKTLVQQRSLSRDSLRATPHIIYTPMTQSVSHHTLSMKTTTEEEEWKSREYQSRPTTAGPANKLMLTPMVHPVLAILPTIPVISSTSWQHDNIQLQPEEIDQAKEEEQKEPNLIKSDDTQGGISAGAEASINIVRNWKKTRSQIDDNSELTKAYENLFTVCTQEVIQTGILGEIAEVVFPFIPPPSHIEQHDSLIEKILKSLFTLSREAENDETLVPLLAIISTQLASFSSPISALVRESRSSLLCMFSLLVNVSMNEAGQRALMKHEWISWFISITEQQMNQHPCQQDADDEERVKLCLEITAVLRNIACAPHSEHLFVLPLDDTFTSPVKTTSTTCIDALCILLCRFPSHPSLCLHILRILSKLSLHLPCQSIMNGHLSTIECMVSLLHEYHNKLALCTRICFTLGNLTMNNDDNRFVIADCLINVKENSVLQDDMATPPVVGLQLLLSFFNKTYQRHIKLSQLVSTTSSDVKNNATTKHHQMHRENLDVCMKLVRVLANISIHPDVGERIANHSDCRFLFNLISLQQTGISAEEEELALNVISCITNLSFYFKPTSAEDNHKLLFLHHSVHDVITSIIPLLFSPNTEIVTETCRLLGNLTRSHVYRLSIIDERLHEAAVLLLDHTQHSIVYACCGILLNITADEEGIEKILSNHGATVHKLIEIGNQYIEVAQAELQHDDEDATDETAEPETPTNESMDQCINVLTLIGKLLCNVLASTVLQRDDQMGECRSSIEERAIEWRRDLSSRRYAVANNDLLQLLQHVQELCKKP